MKKLVILLDGTWNNSEGESGVVISETSTNIARMWRLLDHSQQQRLLYQRGVATDGDWGDAVHGMFGQEIHDKVDQAFAAIVDSADVGDEIYIFGFSRGAATARLLAQKLANDRMTIERGFRVPFLGIFDTVASMGLPGLASSDESYFGYRKSFDHLLKELEIPALVENVVHIIAMHEDRSVFVPTYTVLENPSKTRAEEIWMGGNHGDIGGGWPDSKEDDLEYRRRMISLRHMLEAAGAAGLHLDPRWEEHEDVNVDPTLTRRGTIHGWEDYPFSQRMYGRMPRILDERPTSAIKPTVHPSAINHSE